MAWNSTVQRVSSLIILLSESVELRFCTDFICVVRQMKYAQRRGLADFRGTWCITVCCITAFSALTLLIGIGRASDP